MHGWGMRLARAAVVLLVAGVCWDVFLVDQHVVPGRMAALAVRDPHVPGIRSTPAAARNLPASSSTVAAVRQAAKRHPAHTGIYEIGWQGAGTTPSAANVGLLVQLLPSPALATSVLGDVHRQYGAKRSAGTATYTKTASFRVRGVPGAQGIVYAVTATSGSAGAGTADVVSFRDGPVVVLELLQTAGPAIPTSQAVALAHREDALLQRVGPDRSLQVDSRPLGWSIGLAAGAVAAALAAVFLPEWITGRAERRRRHRERRAHDRAEAERRARGRRTVRRHRAPAWQQRNRRTRARFGH